MSSSRPLLIIALRRRNKHTATDQKNYNTSHVSLISRQWRTLHFILSPPPLNSPTTIPHACLSSAASYRDLCHQPSPSLLFRLSDLTPLDLSPSLSSNQSLASPQHGSLPHHVTPLLHHLLNHRSLNRSQTTPPSHSV